MAIALLGHCIQVIFYVFWQKGCINCGQVDAVDIEVCAQKSVFWTNSARLRSLTPVRQQRSTYKQKDRLSNVIANSARGC
ncbi:hypothetical protein [Pandoravirus japonicus]|uniref:Uncharacterized protein n=1 Tax=Pandoravirus japonicus TaxID=2823154 RepID=A0A811BPE9_9VIRU|nr:hypothetical protein [Pandoravirus japonicus]